MLAVDRAVEAIVDTLRDTGQLRGTYVIFTSDNGFMEGQHRIQAGKLVAYEPATALPLMMRGPGHPGGACLARARDRHRPRADDPRHDQLAATAAGRSTAARCCRSRRRRARPRTSRPRLMEIGPQASQRGDLDQDGGRLRPGVALKAPRYGGVATTRYRYMRYANGQEELYDLARDPDQLDNRIADRRYRKTRSVLRRQLTRLRTCTGAECRKRIGAVPGPTS